jgi:hypothetical protein
MIVLADTNVVSYAILHCVTWELDIVKRFQAGFYTKISQVSRSILLVAYNLFSYN